MADSLIMGAVLIHIQRRDKVFERLYPESFRDTSEVPMNIGAENERKYFILPLLRSQFPEITPVSLTILFIGIGMLLGAVMLYGVNSGYRTHPG